MSIFSKYLFLLIYQLNSYIDYCTVVRIFFKPQRELRVSLVGNISSTSSMDRQKKRFGPNIQNELVQHTSGFKYETNSHIICVSNRPILIFVSRIVLLTFLYYYYFHICYVVLYYTVSLSIIYNLVLILCLFHSPSLFCTDLLSSVRTNVCQCICFVIVIS